MANSKLSLFCAHNESRVEIQNSLNHGSECLAAELIISC